MQIVDHNESAKWVTVAKESASERRKQDDIMIGS